MCVINCSMMNNDIPILNVWSVLFLKSKLGVFHFDSLESEYGWMRCYVMMNFWFFYILRMLCLLYLWSGICSLHLIWTGIIFVIVELNLGNWIVMNALWYCLGYVVNYLRSNWAFHFNSLEFEYAWMHCCVMMDFLPLWHYICSVSDLGFFLSLHACVLLVVRSCSLFVND